jgi:predicted small lipoprotein YifL
MSVAARSAALLLALACVTGCGLKGPLYIPTEEQRQQMAERERLLKEREERERAAKETAAQQQSQPTTQPQQ